MLTPPHSASPKKADTITLRLASGNGATTRQILRTPPRDATASEIPIIDVSGIHSSSFADRAAVAEQIRAAATNTGFFYLTNHGVPSSVTDNAHAACLDFFHQDSESKMKADVSKSAYFNGYKAPKTQRINPFEGLDMRETFSWTYDPRLDPEVGDLDSIPAHIRKHLRVEPDGPPGASERFPWSETHTVPQFAPAVLVYWRSCLALARALVRSFALSLDLDETYFDEKFSHPDAAFALNYYPPLVSPVPSSGGDVSKEVSIGSHTDFQLFTILWQDQVGGLQVLNKEGQWINARPVEETFVVNIADYMQRITNGKYQSTVHRAVNRSGRERVSMPFFFGFNLNESCGVLANCVNEGEVAKYEEVGCAEWVRRRVKAMHDIKAAEENKKGEQTRNKASKSFKT
ncbi:unnamed protein product [Discula destructiva]